MKQLQGEYLWWQSGVIYQIYPRSFQDSNADGVGDLKGIISRLDYLKWLGVKAVWLSPIYPSPMADFGYDISDYTGIHPLFGNMADFDALLEEVHQAGMKLILDFVPNHTSDQHPWFLESKSSRDDPKRDWYIWRDPMPDGSPPNNWLSVFGGSGWEWDENTGQYYYHGFLKEQPDLNWRNPEVQEAMLNSIRFWLDKGVDGFRVDVMWHMIKDADFKNNPTNPNYNEESADYNRLIPVYSTDQPEVHDIVRKMRALLDQYHERMMVGEIYLPVHQLVSYYGLNNDEAHLPFNFLLLSINWHAPEIARAVSAYEDALPAEGWPNWVLGNHDQSRVASRVGAEQAKIAALLLLTLRGTPTIYYGDELGMKDVLIPAEEIQDPQGLNMPDKNLSRDPARTPMQWDTSENAGFTTSKPWLRVDSGYQQQNVETEKQDPHSILNLYKRLVELRNLEPALHAGSFRTVYTDEKVFAYLRAAEGRASFLIILNFTHEPVSFSIPDLSVTGTVLISTSGNRDVVVVNNRMDLNPDEGLVIRLLNQDQAHLDEKKE